MADVWWPESEAPVGVWLLTRREGEDGENVCALRHWPDGMREWIERGAPGIPGRTTITHSTFAAPDWWTFMPKDAAKLAEERT